MSKDRMQDKNKVQYTPHAKRLKSAGSGGEFSQKAVEISDSPLYVAQGYEKLFLALYFIALPYITGLLFLFFYVCGGEYKLFLSLDQGSSFILTWAIGYEILAVLSLLYIMKSAISFSRENARKGKKKGFVIP